MEAETTAHEQQALESQFDDLMGGLDGSTMNGDMIVTESHSEVYTESASETQSSQGEREGSPSVSDTAEDVHYGATVTSPTRIEDTLADFQPPKRYVKEEKKTASGASSTFIMNEETAYTENNSKKNPALLNLGGTGDNVCKICQKRVYEMEKIIADNKIYHKTCFKCQHCQRVLSLGNFAAMEGQLYCKPHFISNFRTKGNYDEGFGREKHTQKWQGRTDTVPSGEAYSSEAGLQQGSDVEADRPRQEPDIVHAGDDVEGEGVEHLPSISNLKSRFEGGSGPSSRAQPAPAARHDSYPNGDYDEDEAYGNHDIVRESRDKEEVSFTEINSVRSRFESSSSQDHSRHTTPSPRKSPSRWSEQTRETNQTAAEYHQEPQPIENEMPPEAVTRNLVSKFTTYAYAEEPEPARKPVRKMTPPRDELEAQVAQANVESYASYPQYEEEEEDEPIRSPDIIRADDPADREDELPPPAYTKSILSKFQSMESSAPQSHATPSKKHSIESQKRVKASPDSGISDNETQAQVPPTRTNGYHENGTPDPEPYGADVMRESDQHTEEELPERGFTKSLLAQWQTKLGESSSPSRSSTTKTRKDSQGSTGKPVSRSWSYKQQQAQKTEVTSSYSQDVRSSQSSGLQNDVSDGGVSENEPVRNDDVFREGDKNEEEYLPPPSYTKNMLAKFQSLEAQHAQQPQIKPKQKQFKWQVKETNTLNRPYKHTQAVVQTNGDVENEPELMDEQHHEEIVQSEYSEQEEMPPQAHTKSMLARFKSFENQGLPPPSPERSAHLTKEAVKSQKAVGMRTMSMDKDPYAPGDVREQPDGDEFEEIHTEQQQQYQFGYDDEEDEGEYHDPNVIRESDRNEEEELPGQGTTQGLLAKFKALQSNAY